MQRKSLLFSAATPRVSPVPCLLLCSSIWRAIHVQNTLHVGDPVLAAARPLHCKWTALIPAMQLRQMPEGLQSEVQLRSTFLAVIF